MLVIGRKNNASIKSVGQAISNKDQEFLANLAVAQADAGADYIDVNAGVGQDAREDASAIMEWVIDVVQNATDKPVCIDSDDPAVLEAALNKYRGEAVMINSVNAEPERLESVGRLAADRKASLIALVMKEEGIPRTVEERLDAAEIIIKHLTHLGVQEDKIYFDPLVLPISVDSTQALITIKPSNKLNPVIRPQKPLWDSVIFPLDCQTGVWSTGHSCSWPLRQDLTRQS
jgi:Methionine synthase I, cobalamin-binding domain